MKKTLVALAALAATGASFAQVAITGQLTMGYTATTTAAAGDASGLGINDSNVTFAATEDLGGGMKVVAKMKIDKMNRKDIKGGDSTLALSTSAGTFTLGTAEQDTDTGDRFGMTGGTMSTAILGGGHTRTEVVQDFASYSTNFGALAVSFKHAEAPAVLGIGTGAAGSSAQRDNTIAVDYAVGALALSADYTMYDNKTANTVGSFDNRMTVGGTYDLGAVKLGAGVQNTKYTLGSAMESLVGVSVPMGALTVGADYVSIKTSDTGADGTATGYALQGIYALSKRTDVRFRYARYDATMNPATKDTYTSLILRHTF
jgi:hypothetical protein